MWFIVYGLRLTVYGLFFVFWKALARMEAASFCEAQRRKRYSGQPEQLLKKLVKITHKSFFRKIAQRLIGGKK
jgi:hypothetical protein